MRVSRRTALRSALAPVALGWAPASRAEAQTAARHSSFDPWIEVRPEHVRHNVREVSRLVAGRPILAVIKNNAYGMGLINMARILESEASVTGMAVVRLNEAIELRDAGITKPILLMGPFDDADLEEAVMRDVMPMVYTEVGDALSRLATRRQSAIPVQVCVDTGMGRVGVPHRHAAGLIADLAGREGVNLVATMTTLNEDPEFEKLQLQRFREVEETLTARGISMGRRHAAASYALFDNPPAYLDVVRPGMALFGQYSMPKFRDMGLLDLRPSMSLKARVVLVKELQKGETAGYEAAYKADRDVWIATIPAGHVDGVPRAAAKGGWVRIGETRYPIIASVSSSHTIVEIGPQKTVQEGDIATYFDWQDGSRPEDASAASGASVYDLIMHLNPTLPRRLVT